MSMKRSDEALLRRILDTRGEDHRIAMLIREYWADADRADRTPREHLYLHLGIVTGITLRLLEHREMKH